jgi:hypothetical protein
MNVYNKKNIAFMSLLYALNFVIGFICLSYLADAVFKPHTFTGKIEIINPLIIGFVAAMLSVLWSKIRIDIKGKKILLFCAIGVIFYIMLIVKLFLDIHTYSPLEIILVLFLFICTILSTIFLLLWRNKK